MKFARRRSEEPEIGMASLIDVVFLLLIFFMVTTSFVREAGLSIRLPEGGEAVHSSRDVVTVVVNAANRMFIAGDRIAGERALREILARRAATTQVLRIRADGRASHQAVVTVMDAAADVGFARIDIATRVVEAQP